MLDDNESGFNKKDLKVIVIDDSDFSRRSMVSVLGNAGYTVIGDTKIPDEAAALIAATKCHLAIIDVVMPEMNGIDLARDLKDNNKDLYIIMVSSLTQENLVIEAISAGASDFIPKPFTEQVLLDSVEKIVSFVEGEQ